MPSIFGLRLNATREAVLRGRPELLLVPSEGEDSEVGQGELTWEGHRFRARATLYEGRLATIYGHAEGAEVADFERLAALLGRRLGEGARQVCGSDSGASFTELLSTGHGSMRAAWEGEEAQVHLELRGHLGGGAGLTLSGSWLPLMRRHPIEDFKPESPRKERASEQAAGGSGARAASPSACPEVGPSPPRFGGVPFGASPEEAARVLGTRAQPERGLLEVTHTVAGVEGRLFLYFYDGCFASLRFEAEGTEAAYRALQSAGAAELGEAGRRERCSPTGAPPTEEEIRGDQGILSTYWEGAAARGTVRLWTSAGQHPPRVIVERSSVPLRDRAPQIDF